MKARIKILFITPFGGLGGSELYIKNLIDNIDTQHFDLKVFINSNPVTKYDNEKFTYSNVNLSNKVHRIVNKIYKLFFGLSINESKLLRINRKFKPDFWYINTIVLPGIAQLACKQKIPYIIHLHEMPSVYGKINDVIYKNIISNACALFVCSQKQKLYLQAIGASKIFLLPGAVRESITTINKQQQQQLRSKINLPNDAIVFGACGRGSYGKGFDLFVEIALTIKNPKVYFIWAGKINDNGFTYIYKEMAKALNNKIIFLGAYDFDKTKEIFGLFDYFLLTSREDTYPLVMIEAAAMGIPTISFDSGGVSEFVDNSIGYITKGINLPEMTCIIEKVINGKMQFDTNALVLKSKTHSTQIQVENWKKYMLQLYEN